MGMGMGMDMDMGMGIGMCMGVGMGVCMGMGKGVGMGVGMGSRPGRIGLPPRWCKELWPLCKGRRPMMHRAVARVRGVSA